METKKLFNLLTILNGVTEHRWSMVMDIVDYFKNKKVIEIKKEWRDNYKNGNLEYHPLDLKDIKTWSTYEGCVDLIFTIRKDKLYCHAKIFNGDSFDGHRQDLRFFAEFILPDDFIQKLEGTINHFFSNYLECKHEEHLELQKQNWINDLKAEIIYTI